MAGVESVIEGYRKFILDWEYTRDWVGREVSRSGE